MNAMYGHRDAGFFGYSHLTGGFAGGQAEYVRVPFGENNLLPVPGCVSDEQVLYLSDILPTSYHAVVDTGVNEGDVVGIWVSELIISRAAVIQVDNQGLGPIGQCVVRWAKLKGAKRVIGIDNVPERLAFAAEKSGVEIVDFNQHKDVVRRLQELVPGGLNVAIDCGVCGKEYLLFLKLLKLVFDRNVPPTEDSSTQDTKELYA